MLSTFDTADGKIWHSTDLPSPQNDPQGTCNRQKKSALCDPDGFVSDSEGDTIDGLINLINSRTETFTNAPLCRASNQGPQVAVSIVNRMARIPGEDKSTTAYEFARALHDKWQVGDKQCQNGVVLFVSVSDRVIGISIGKGLKSTFTDAMVQPFIKVFGTELKKGQYGQSLIFGVELIGNILAGNGNQVGRAVQGETFGSWLIVGFAGMFIVSGAVSSGRKSRRYSRCKDILKQLDSDRSSAEHHEYVSKSCPICLEDFKESDEFLNPRTKKLIFPSSSSSSDNVQDNDSTIDLEDEITNTEQIALTSSSSSSSTTTADKKKKKCCGTTSKGYNKCSQNKKSKATEVRKIRTLPCGHSFYEDCIMEWFSTPGNSDATCPICRQPISAHSTTSSPALANDSNESAYPQGWDDYDSEYRFRLSRTRHLYPDFVTFSMVNDWDDRRRENQYHLSTSSLFTSVNPAVARSSGTGGSSFSFGGGSSAGGGGGGGGF